MIWNVGDVEVTQQDVWEDIFVNTIKIPPKPKNMDIIIDVSLECKLGTNTLSAEKMSEIVSPLSEANVEVMVKVLVGDEEAQPGEVTFARRFQALVHKNPLDDADYAHTAVVVLDTMTANSFNFIAEDVAHGKNNIRIQAKVVAVQLKGEQCPGHNEYPTAATIGKGSVIIECAKMIDDDDDDSDKDSDKDSDSDSDKKKKKKKKR